MPSPRKEPKSPRRRSSLEETEEALEEESLEDAIVVLSARVACCAETLADKLQTDNSLRLVQRQSRDLPLEDLQEVVDRLNAAVNSARLEQKLTSEENGEPHNESESVLIEPGEAKQEIGIFSASDLASEENEAVALLFRGSKCIQRVQTKLLEDAEMLKIIAGAEGMDVAEEDIVPENLGKWLLWCEDVSSFNLLNAFFFIPTPLSEVDALTPRRGFTSQPTSSRVSLETLLAFLFPWKQQHPRSTGRLFVFGAYGPLDDGSNMRAGIRGQHRLQKHEIDAMVDQVDFDDILRLYIGDQILTPEEQQAVHSQANPALKEELQLTKAQVRTMFKDVPRDEDGTMCFHHLQRIIFDFRKDRMKRWLKICQSGIEQTRMHN